MDYGFISLLGLHVRVFFAPDLFSFVYTIEVDDMVPLHDHIVYFFAIKAY